MNVEELEGEPVKVAGTELQLDEQLGTGAEGSVYSVKGSTDRAVKIFNEEKRPEKAEKVRAMIENDPIDPTLRHRGVRSIVWPTDVVEDAAAGSFLGYTMPRLNLSAHKNAQRYAREDLAWDTSSAEERYITALNLALVVKAVHRQGHAMGDFNHQNVLVRDCYVSLIDCDGFYIRGEQDTHEGDTFFPRYTPPEGRASTLVDVRRGDLFGLGVHIFQLLMEGFHPYQVRGSDAVSGSYADMIQGTDDKPQGNPFVYESPEPGKVEPHAQAPDYDTLPQDIRDLFSDCFDIGRNRPSSRPKADEWDETLRDVLGLFDAEESDPESTETMDSTDDSDRHGSTTPGGVTTGEGRPDGDSSTASVNGTSGTATASGGTAGTRSGGTSATGQHQVTTSPSGNQSTSTSGGSTAGTAKSAGTRGTTPRRTGRTTSQSRRGSSWADRFETVQSELVRLAYYLLGFLLVAIVGYGLLQMTG